MKEKVLLHICCAPDSTAVFERLQTTYEVIGFFHNPNIQPVAEWEKRSQEAVRVGSRMGFHIIVPAYQPQAWLDAVKGWEAEPERGKRCGICFDFNLHATAEQALQLGISRFTTTLSISPHKRTEMIFSAGTKAAAAFGRVFLALDFKKQEGFKRSLDLSKELSLYRQNYCGCQFSRQENSRA